MPGALVSPNFFNILNKQFLNLVIFANSNLYACILKSLLTLLVIVIHWLYSKIIQRLFVVLTQCFLLMSNIFLKVSPTNSESNKKTFLLFKHIFRVCQSSFGLSPKILFFISFDSCLDVISCIFEDFPISLLRQLDLKIINCWRQQTRSHGSLIFISVHSECVHLQLRQVL